MCASPAASSVTLGFWPLADTVIGACTAAFADAAANAKRTRARAVTTPRGRQRAMRPRLSALYRDPQLPALYFGHLSGGRTVVGDGGREHLAGDIVLVSLRGGDQLVVTAQRQLDSVLDVQARLLARVLHRAHDLARQALANQRVVELQVQRDRVRARA